MAEAWIIGSHSTAFGRRPAESVKDLTRAAFEGVLADAGLDDAGVIEAAWFGNCGMWVDRQGSIRGQVCLTPLVREGRFPERAPVVNVEAGCATGSLALHGARNAVLAGECDFALALGVEKTFYPADPARSQALFEGGIDQYDPAEWQAYYRAAGEASRRRRGAVSAGRG